MMKTLLVVFVISSFVYAKDKTLADYPIQVTVTGDAGGRLGGASTSLQSNSRIYIVSCEHWNCYQFDLGTKLQAREGSIWGVPWLEVAWMEKGKLKTLKYTIRARSIK